MCRTANIGKLSPSKTLAVVWQDCVWTPPILAQTSAAPARRGGTNPLPGRSPLPHIVCRSKLPKIMKTLLPVPRRQCVAFTLVELLVVIAIIGILAGMILPVLAAAKTKALRTKAQIEVQDIANAIIKYDSDYSRFPVSSPTQDAASKNRSPANPNGSDFTYGAAFNGGNVTIFQGSGIIQSNDEVIAILMNLTNYPNGSGATANNNYQKNPQKTIYLSAKMSGYDPSQPGKPMPGVGNDLVYRDPWGNPYVISMDLNYDDQCEDSFYCLQKVSQQNGQTGYNGLVNTTDPGGNGNHFRYHGKVMVWSAGQDGKIDPNDPATDWENKNNILSWQ